MKDSYFLGVDTSNYTTSVAVVNGMAELVAQHKQLLPVKTGQRGLRQSEALFWHIKNFPEVVNKLVVQVPEISKKIKAVGITNSPRPLKGSYMPVFLAGIGLGKTLASMLSVPYYELSHQENHLWAGLINAIGLNTDRFIAVHLSGGTTEVLEVVLDEHFRFSINVIGDSLDLHAGQFVDRVGVAMGLSFPAGPQLEQLALQSTKKLIIPSYHRKGKISFAGPESAALRLLASSKPKADIAHAVFVNIARTLTKWIKWAVDQANNNQVLLTGGVFANSLIRKIISQDLSQVHLYFTPPDLSTDNAVGAAVYSGICSHGRHFLGNVF